jgi:GTPase SAR1 family protein
MLRKPTLKSIVTNNLAKKKNDSFNKLFEAQSIGEVDGNPSILPLNTNIYLVGNKSSGKSTFINCFIRDQFFDENDKLKPARQYQHVFNIHSENIDSSGFGMMPESVIIDVPGDEAKDVLMSYIRIKHKFVSCIRFIRDPSYTDHIIKAMRKHNRIDDVMPSNPNDDVEEYRTKLLSNIAHAFIDKYSKTFEIAERYRIHNGFEYLGYTLIVIHDANQHPDLFGTTAKNSFIYYISEVARHFMGCLVIACQSLDQITACCRKGIVCCGLFHGFTYSDIAKLPRMNSELVRIFRREYPHLRKYEAIFINFDRNELEVLKTDFCEPPTTSQYTNSEEKDIAEVSYQ